MKSVITVIFTILAFNMHLFAQKTEVKISGTLSSINDGEKVKIKVKPYGYPLDRLDRDYVANVANHKFSIDISNIDHPTYIDISYKSDDTHSESANKYNRLILHDYLIQAGDQIYLTEKDLHYQFSGIGAIKFTIREKLDEIGKHYMTGYSIENPGDIIVRFQKQDSAFKERINFLRKNRQLLSSDIYTLFFGDCLGDLFTRSNGLELMTDSGKRIAVSKLGKSKDSAGEQDIALKDFDKHNVLRYSSSYTNWGLPEKYMLDSCFKLGRRFDLSAYFKYVTKAYTGGVRDRLLVNLLVPRLDSSANISQLVDTALITIKSPELKNLLYELKSHRQSGAVAYDFDLPDTAGYRHHYVDFKGKVVLMDFWFTGCGSCATAKPFLEKIEQSFAGQPVVFLTINNDRDKATWIKGLKSGRYTSDLGIDLFTEGLAFKHPLSKYYNIDGGPYFILIGKDGKLTAIPENPSNDGGANLSALIKQAIQQ